MGLAFAVVSLFLVQQLESSLIAEVDRSNDARAADLVSANEIELNNLGLSVDDTTVAALIVAFDDEAATIGASTDENLTIEQILEAFPTTDTPGSVSWPNLTDTEGSDNMRGVTQDLTLFDEETGESYVVGDLVFVASSLDSVDRSVEGLRENLLFAGPLLILVVAGLVWWLTGRALQPVEAIRAEAESIRGSDLYRRVPETGADDEVGRLALTFNSMLDRIEASQRTQQQFVSDASHELRSPLASIATQLDVDAAHPATADHAASAKTIRAQTSRMQAMIEDLLLLARADDGSLAPEKTLVDLDDVVTEVAHTIVVPPHVQIDLSGLQGGTVRGSAGQIHRLLTNLTTNAVRHARSVVAIRVESVDGSVVMTVGDDGVGIDPWQREAIFDRFVRLDEARAREAGGSGLGLAICAEIAEAHDAAIAVGVAEQGGAEFTVTFPAV